MPHGPGPHPTPDESLRKAAALERQYAQSERRRTNPPLPAGGSLRGGNVLIKL